MADNALTLLAAAFAALLVGIVDALLYAIGAKYDGPTPSASDAWYD